MSVIVTLGPGGGHSKAGLNVSAAAWNNSSRNGEFVRPWTLLLPDVVVLVCGSFGPGFGPCVPPPPPELPPPPGPPGHQKRMHPGKGGGVFVGSCSPPCNPLGSEWFTGSLPAKA